MQNTGLMRRVGAMLYDALLVFALLMLTAIPFIAIRGGDAVAPSSDLFFRLSLLAVIYVFFVGFWIRSGRTLGMQSWGLQLETPDGSVPGIGAASIRFAAAIVSWIPLGLGYLWQLWDKDSLTWHDRISKTRIVHYPKEKS